MSAFAKSLGATALILCLAIAAASALWPSVHFGAALGGLLLMALNAVAALAFLRLRVPAEPVLKILVSMAGRLLVVGAAMVVALLALLEPGAQAFSFVFAALAAYAVFQVVEIRLILRHPEWLRA